MIMNNWFECKVRTEKMLEGGATKKVTEPYLVDALNFTEAEARITEEISPFCNGQLEVVDIKRARYCEMFTSELESADKWYKVKLQFIIIDEKSGKEKLSAVNYLVQSNTLQNAVKNVEEVMDTGMQDWKLASVAETTLMDVFEHDGTKHVNKVVKDDRPEYEDAMNAELQAGAENVEA